MRQFGKGDRVEVFEYPASAQPYAQTALEGVLAEESDFPLEEEAPAQSGACSAESVHAEYEKRLGEENRRAFEAGRAEGRQAEREAHGAALRQLEEKRVQQARELVASFALERDRYLQAVEQEVVRLALAVAARILRREAQMDPLLLTGAVRVALGQLSSSTTVRLRVPGPDADLWREAIALLPKMNLKPEVIATEGMRLGDCVVETELGTVNLGIRAQLAEIERGFFDRAGGLRPEAREAEAAHATEAAR
jgi:flagellar assembly protein FliH